MAQKYFFAYWVQTHPDFPEKIIKCVRGPETDQTELLNKVSNIWHGHYEVAEINTRDANKVRTILNDRLTQMAQDLGIALKRFSWTTPRESHEEKLRLQHQQT